MANERPMVVDGEFTKFFWQDVAAADAHARAQTAKKPKCAKCGQALCLDQPGAHYSCVGAVNV